MNAKRKLVKLSLIAACLIFTSGCSSIPVSLPPQAAKCEIPTTTDHTVTGLVVVAVEMRQALEECNRRNGYE
jgi:hypothetical protein